MRSGSSVVLIALAVADTLILLVGPTFVYVKEIHGINIEQRYLSVCKTNRYLKSVFGYAANWLVIIFTIFRVIAVYWPHKVNVYCTRRRACVAVFLTCALSAFGNLDSLIFSQHIPKYNKEGRIILNKCWYTGSRHIYYKFYNQWVLLVTMSIIPFVILISGNSMIICKMIKYNLQRRQMSVEKPSKGTESLTAMLISISLLFLVTQIPVIAVGMVKRKLEDVPRSEEFLYSLYLIDGITKLLKWTNHALNFFCYCIAGKRFRQEFIAMLNSGLLCFQRKKLSESAHDFGEVTVETSVSNHI